MTTSIRCAVLTAVLCLAGAGCRAPAHRVRFDPIPMDEALGIVTDNQARIRSTLRAAGTADGYFTTPDGRRRSYHVDATLFFLAPAYLRFDLKKFGDRQVLFGSNDESYWYYSKEDGEYFCGRHDAPDDLPDDLPIRPDQIIDAVGLGSITEGVEAGGLLQRVEEDHQQLLFVAYDDQGRPVLQKEYWLDRYAPQLLRRVVFRDSDGVVEMRSELSRYDRLAPGGPSLPHVMLIDWPKSGARMHFRVGKWTPFEQITSDNIQFATPRECDAQ